MKKVLLFILLSFTFSSLSVARNYIWNPQGGSTSSSTLGNWKYGTTACGNTIATIAITSSDTITFSGTCSNGNCHIDANLTVKMIMMKSTYTGTVSINTGITFTFETSSFKGGSFTASNAALTCSNDLLIDGTSFTSTSGDFTLKGNFSLNSGSFTHNSGKVIFQHGTRAGTRIITSSSNSVTVSFYKVEFAAPDSDTQFNIRNMTMELNNELKISGSHQVFLNTSTSSLIKAKGDIVSSNSSTVGGGDITIEVNGTGNQVINDNYGSDASGKLPGMKINKATGILSLQGNIVLGGSNTWDYISGTINHGLSKLICSYNNTLKNNSGGSMRFYDLEIIGAGGCDSIKGTIQILNSLTTSSTGNCKISTTNGGNGVFNIQGNLQWNNTATTFGNITFQFTGNQIQLVGGTTSPVLYNVEINKPNGQVTLQKEVFISNNLNLIKGFIGTDTINVLTFKNGSTVTNASNISFVKGAVKKIGNAAFVFPVGKGSSFGPIEITAPANSSAAFRAEYFNTSQALGNNKDTFTYVSSCEYWQLTRTAGTNSVKVKLFWDSLTCDIYTTSTLRMGRWDGTKWASVGAITTSGTVSSGNIQSSSSLSSFTYFLIAKKSPIVYAHAGSDKTVCLGAYNYIGASPSATGGLTPYSYQWFPSWGLNNSHIANPVASPNETQQFILTVTDLDHNIASDTINVTVRDLQSVSAGKDRSMFIGDTIELGDDPTASGKAPFNYLWSPSTGLSSLTTSNPKAIPSTSIAYSVLVEDSDRCLRTETIHISVLPYSLKTAQHYALLAADSILVTEASVVNDKAGSKKYISSSITASAGTDIANAVADTAVSHLQKAMDAIDNLSGTTISGNLSDVTLGEGIYKISGNATLDGKLTLEGDGESIFIIDIQDSMKVYNKSKVELRGILPSQLTIRIGSALICYDTTFLQGIYLASGKIIGGNQSGQAAFLGQSKILFTFLDNAYSPKYLFLFISIPTSLETYRTIPDDFLGFNGSNTTDYEADGWGAADLLFATKLRSLYTGTIRFIGGAKGNYWDYQNGRYLTSDEIPNFGAITNNAPLSGYGVPNEFSAVPPLPANMLSDFKLGIDKGLFQPIYLLNMLTDSLAIAIDLLYKAKCLGLPLKYAELGNEFYLAVDPNYSFKYPTPLDYKDDANNWAAKIKEVFPDIKLAAVGVTRKDGNPRSIDWMDGLGLTATGNILYNDLVNFPTSGIDALTYHVYTDAGIGNVAVVPANLSKVFAHAYDEIEAKYTVPTGDFTVFTNNEYYEGWITEYGFTDRNQAVKTSFLGTWAEGLYHDILTLRFLEENRITHINCQTVLDNGFSGAIFNHFGNESADPNPFEFTCIGNAMLPICRAMRFSTTAKKIDFEINEYLGNSNYPVLYGYYFDGETAEHAVILNLSGEAKTIQTLGILPDGGKYESYVGWGPSGNDPLWPVTGDYSSDGTNGVLHYPAQDIQGNEVELPPYSVTRLYYKKDGLTIYASTETACIGEPVTISAFDGKINSTLTFTYPTGTYSESGPKADKVISFTSPGTQTVTVHTSQGNITKTLYIVVGDELSVSLLTSSGSICDGEEFTINVSGSAVSYNWSPGEGLSAISGMSVVASPDQTTTYTLHVTNWICYCNSIDPITVTVLPEADAGPDIFTCDEFYSHKHPTLGPAIVPPDADFTWSVEPPGLTLDSYDYSNPKIIAANPGIYTAVLTLVTTAPSTCESRDSVDIRVVECCTGSSEDVVLDPYTTELVATMFLSGNYWLSTNVEAYFLDIEPAGYAYDDATYSIKGDGANGALIINGPFYVDGSYELNWDDVHEFKFKNCDNIKMGPFARIFINDGVSFSLIDDNLSACSDMWAGIYGADQDAKLVIKGTTNTSSVVKDALNAVLLRYDTDYNIENTTFDYNYNHLRLEEFKNQYDDPGVSRTIFGNDFLSSTPLKEPHDNHKCDTAIALQWNAGTPFGDADEDANEIDGARRFGIYNFKSNLDVYNNNFTSLDFSTQTKAIQCLAGPFNAEPIFPYNSKVHIGEGSWGSTAGNTFAACSYGVNISGYKAWVNGNTMTEVNYGITLNYLDGNSAEVKSNIITTNSGVTPVGIRYKEYNTNSCINCGTVVIGVVDAGNEINSEGQAGIQIIESINTNVNHNRITMAKTAASIQPLYGIHITGANGMTMRGNWINDIDFPSSGYYDCGSGGTGCNTANKTAIFLSMSTDALIKCNFLNATYTGLKFLDDCTAPSFNSEANIQGNRFEWHTDGLALGVSGFAQSVISDQGLVNGNKTPGNCWFGDGNEHSIPNETYNYGDPQPPLLFVFTDDECQIPENNNHAGGFASISPTGVGNNPISCNSSQGILSGDFDDTFWEGVAENLFYSGVNKEALNFNLKSTLFSALSSNNNILGRSAILSNFYDSTLYQTIGQLYKVDSLIARLADTTLSFSVKLEIIADAISKNSSISASEIFETNQQSVNDIYLNTVAQRIFSFDSSQFASLKYVADQCPYSGGKTVFKARALLTLISDTLDWDDEDICSNTPRYSEMIDTSNSNEESLYIYPNPTNATVNIDYHLTQENNCSFIITDIIGQVLISKFMDCNKTSIIIDFSKYTAGVYFVSILSNGEAHLSEKIVVTK